MGLLVSRSLKLTRFKSMMGKRPKNAFTVFLDLYAPLPLAW